MNYFTEFFINSCCIFWTFTKLAVWSKTCKHSNAYLCVDYNLNSYSNHSKGYVKRFIKTIKAVTIAGHHISWLVHLKYSVCLWMFEDCYWCLHVKLITCLSLWPPIKDSTYKYYDKVKKVYWEIWKIKDIKLIERIIFFQNYVVHRWGQSGSFNKMLHLSLNYWFKEKAIFLFLHLNK